MARKSAKTKVSRYAHAADLPAALDELEEALRTAPSAWTPVMAEGVAVLSADAVWTNADAIVAGWERVAAAARRVKVAQLGPRIARRWSGFTRGNGGK